MGGDAMSDFYGPISDATFQKALHFARNIYSFHRESGLGPQAARRKTWDAVQRASYGVRSQFGAHITYSHEIGSIVSQAAEEIEAERKNPSSPRYATKKRRTSRRDPASVSRRDASQGKLRRELGVIGNAIWHMPKSAGPWIIYWNGPGSRLLFGSNRPGTQLSPIEYPGAEGHYRTLKEATAAVARFWKKQ